MRAHRNVMLASAVVAGVVLAGCGGGDTTAGGGGTAPAEGRPQAAADDRSSAAPTTSVTPAPTTAAPTTAPTTAPSTSTTRAPATPPAAASTARPAPAPPADAATRPAASAPRGGEPRFTCPRGGMDAVTALQDSFEQGHQPWRGSPEMVAAACAFGTVGTSVEPAGPHRYLVTDDATGESAVVEVAQPLGPGTIWVAVTVSPG